MDCGGKRGGYSGKLTGLPFGLARVSPDGVIGSQRSRSCPGLRHISSFGLRLVAFVGSGAEIRDPHQEECKRYHEEPYRGSLGMPLEFFPFANTVRVRYLQKFLPAVMGRSAKSCCEDNKRTHHKKVISPRFDVASSVDVVRWRAPGEGGTG